LGRFPLTVVDEWGNHGNKFDQATHGEIVRFLVDHGQWKAAQTVYDSPTLGRDLKISSADSARDFKR
jgi:hypothetical protein